jgi:ribulose 1,5-bisphosphate synthetase/thiazole synthase
MMSSFSQLVALALMVSPVLGTLYRSPSELDTLHFNYIVVGGGTAGNVVANRLTENARVSVLVLEAGIA